MSDQANSSEQSPLTDSRLRFVYIAGLALNVIALSTAAMAGEWLIAVTFGFIIVYLCMRYWLLITS